MMPKQKKKNKNTAKSESEGECEGAEGGLVDLGLDDENEEKKLKQIAYEEEKCINDFLETMNKQILKKECGVLALSYSRSENAFDQVKRNLGAIQVKRATKHQQKQEQKAQIQYKDLKRQRNEVLARLVISSMHIGKHEQYFVDDPMGTTDTKQKEYVEKIKKANKVVQALVHEEDQRCAQDEAKKEKQKQGRKVVHFNL